MLDSDQLPSVGPGSVLQDLMLFRKNLKEKMAKIILEI